MTTVFGSLFEESSVTSLDEVTTRDRYETELKKINQFLQEAQQIANLGCWEWDLVTKESIWSDEVFRILGYDPAVTTAALNLWLDRVHPEDKPDAPLLMQEIQTGAGFFENEHRIVLPDQSVRYLFLKGMQASDDQEGWHKIIGIVQDITERKWAEEENARLEILLKQAQKMESIGTLAGGIAHDFNNILSPIMIYAEMAMMDMSPDNPFREHIQNIYKAGERAKNLVKQILTFARPKDEEKMLIEASLILKEMVRFLRSTLPSSIRILHNFETENDTILADPTQVHQILMNLCTNASYAMRESGGALSVNLINRMIGLSDMERFPGIKPGQYLELSVSDTGCGIPREIMEQIFEPCYTTKPAGEGTGMGLALVHSIVESNGGAIVVESEIGKGTTFHILWPTAATNESLSVTETMVECTGGTERILIVDDEQGIVAVTKNMLECLGYQVLASTDSIEALEIFLEEPGGFDLIITDQTMPNMTGRELAERVKSVRSDIPVIICTGFSEQLDQSRAPANVHQCDSDETVHHD